MDERAKVYWVYPEGFDPVIAEGEPPPDYVDFGIVWTPEDTERHRAMKPALSNHPIAGRWHADAR